VEKSLLEIYRLFVSTDFGGVLKMYFDELKMCFLPNDIFKLSMVHT
jgi:hypothetical protein